MRSVSTPVGAPPSSTYVEEVFEDNSATPTLISTGVDCGGGGEEGVPSAPAVAAADAQAGIVEQVAENTGIPEISPPQSLPHPLLKITAASAAPCVDSDHAAVPAAAVKASQVIAQVGGQDLGDETLPLWAAEEIREAAEMKKELLLSRSELELLHAQRDVTTRQQMQEEEAELSSKLIAFYAAVKADKTHEISNIARDYRGKEVDI